MSIVFQLYRHTDKQTDGHSDTNTSIVWPIPAVLSIAGMQTDIIRKTRNECYIKTNPNRIKIEIRIRLQNNEHAYGLTPYSYCIIYSCMRELASWQQCKLTLTLFAIVYEHLYACNLVLDIINAEMTSAVSYMSYSGNVSYQNTGD